MACKSGGELFLFLCSAPARSSSISRRSPLYNNGFCSLRALCHLLQIRLYGARLVFAVAAWSGVLTFSTAAPAEKAVARSACVTVQENSSGFRSVCAARSFPAGATVLQLSGDISSVPTRTSIEIGPDRHIEDPVGRFINHSFEPSCVIRDGAVVALHDIAAGDEVTFNYNDNETSMACPFIDSNTNFPVHGKAGPRESRSAL